METFYTDDFFDLIHNVFFNSLGGFFISFLIPFIAVELININGFTMGILFSLEAIGFLLSSLFAGFLSDRYSKKNIIVIGSFGRGIAYLMLYFALVFLNLNLLFLSNFLLGLLTGVFVIPFDSLIADKTLEENRSQAYGIKSASKGKGIFIGAFIGFTILLIFYPNKQLMFIPILIFGLANFYASMKYSTTVSNNKIFSEEQSKEKKDSILRLVDLDTNILATILILCLVTLFFAMEESIAQSYIIPYFLINLSSNEMTATFIYIPVGLVSILLGAKIGKRMDRVNYAVGIIICSILNAIAIYFLIQTKIIFLFSFLLIIIEILSIAIMVSLANIFSRFSKIHRGKIIGFQSFFNNIGGILGSLGGGLLWQYYSMKTPFIFSILLNAILIPVFIIMLNLSKFSSQIFIHPKVKEGI